MTEMIAQGWIIPAVLGLMALEWGVLALWYLRHKTGPHPTGTAANLLAGGGLLLAMRAGVMGDVTQAGVWMALAGLGHIGDLVIRFRQKR